MAHNPNPKGFPTFNVAIVAQGGRVSYEALLFVASFRHSNPNFTGRLMVLEPQPNELWNSNPRIRPSPIRESLLELGAEIIPFEAKHFGSSYPNGNKIEMLMALPKGEPFIFFDSDTLILDDLTKVPFDFNIPSASNRVEGTWPTIELYGPGYDQTWQSLYDRFDIDFQSSLDLTQPEEYWRRYLYFNAGYFYYRCPHEFGSLWLEYALSIRDDPPEAIICQTLYPWLDQITLPLVIHKLNGRRDALPEGLLDGSVSCHYRLFPLLYARESDAVVDHLETVCAPNKLKKVLKQYDAIKRTVYQGRGHKVRVLFDRDNLPTREQAIRNRIKSEGFWMR